MRKGSNGIPVYDIPTCIRTEQKQTLASLIVCNLILSKYKGFSRMNDIIFIVVHLFSDISSRHALVVDPTIW